MSSAKTTSTHPLDFHTHHVKVSDLEGLAGKTIKDAVRGINETGVMTISFTMTDGSIFEVASPIGDEPLLYLYVEITKK